MFGVGIFEILIILIVAIIALGPDKLPQAIVDVVKFFRAVKKTMLEAKDSFDKELQLSEIKQEALKYKHTIESEVDKITKDIKLDELRQISVDSISKPLDEEKKSIDEATQALQSSLQSLNTELSYESPNAAASLPDTKASAQSQEGKVGNKDS
ncbi:Sec-independent protein translocase protein TatB [Helicobacter marmotae]|uniref:Sec-independent protein translocase protein TatB homolog n=1 Tax=Helicobacter marmotae TaxID=152490 RepID=A0A3D8I778_9HELI|nr:Sec-independent protein translocase protein TatB [Helicobacter marmotae]RDU61030.1 Sec-independent protein translocase subunit TatB [Helicobacter marmotae]